jgi:S-DNA-T family DNA segregation ATPase FtsK/SpoIIIE
MSSSLSSARIRELLAELRRLTANRAKAESETAQTYSARTEAARKAFEQAKAKLETKHTTDRAAADRAYEQAKFRANVKADEGLKAARNVHGTAREEAIEQYQTAEEEATREYQEAKWTQDAMLEARAKKAKSLRDQAGRQYTTQTQAASALRQEALDQLQKWKLVPPGAGAADSANPSGDPLPAVTALVAAAREQVGKLKGLIAPRLLVGDRFLWGAFIAWSLLALGGYLWMEWWGAIAATIVTFVGGVGLWFALKARSRSQAAKIGQPLFRDLAEAERLARIGEEAAEVRYRKEEDEAKRSHKEEVRLAEKAHRTRLAEVLQSRDDTLKSADDRLAKLTVEFTGSRDKELTKVESDNREKVTTIECDYGRESTELNTKAERERADSEAWHQSTFQKLAEDWHNGTTRVRADLNDCWSQNNCLFPNWDGPAWSGWNPPTSVPAGVRFGELAIDVAALPGGQPTDPKLQAFEPDRFTVPALLPFPHRCATLLHTAGDGKAAAVQALQAIMLRFLTSLPPGKVRFTIIDPVGLGENFASFMHLADYDEQLVGARIWTETAQIEKRLADTTEHMENVIQKYLRNQYASIEEYNEQAGEVAEPYRVLVVANFPANFSLEAARRLASIAASGANCGVFTLVSFDPRQTMPQGFPLVDLEQASLNLRWQHGHFEWEDTDFSQYPLTLDAPPDPTELAAIVQVVGAKAKEAGRVEVDFEFVAPPADRWWAGDSRGGISVPLGRSGATKRQMLALGKGTSQHALVAGKTGSGKSTLLHALITNLALHYGPEEMELYLIDFKKGVEFKTYANHELPHARVIAVESEREFGLSVLQRLDAELKRRGDLFRTAGVQDVASYREKMESTTKSKTGAAVSMPRILFVVDEFQEFFVEDDKLSQEAALLLDRLVRQGRAFGLHVLLGSQTLGGAYSLARSTIDQMGVRIALQCSEADANLILSKDNNAARLLSRPGEAIYNDANGLIEGNDVFQVVWLPEPRREVYLDRLRLMAREQNFAPAGPTIVFEGNNPADVESNHLLRRLLHDGPPTSARDRTVWLGDALAIKDPTAAVFRRQSGSNLLVIGQQAEPARAVLIAATVALAAQDQRGDDSSLPTVTVLDGSPADDPQAGYFGRVASVLPDHVRVASLRDKPNVLDQLAEELARRQQDPHQISAPLFLIVYGLHRFRDLRKAEDDFGYGRRGEEKVVTPAERFAELVREGPAVGIHLFVWVDSLANAQRALDRSGLREFEMRVLFQMSVADSSTLIDTPAASRLGLNRALFASEEMSAPEKFRPYRLPSEEWLREVSARLSRSKTLSPA